jgi:hypothetical protein
MKRWLLIWTLFLMACTGSGTETAVSPFAETPLPTETAVDPTPPPIVADLPTPGVVAEATAVAEVAPPTTSDDLLLRTFSYSGVSLRYGDQLARTISGETTPATAGAYGFGVDGPPLFYNGVPDLIRLTFANDFTAVRPTLLIIQPIRDDSGQLYSSYPDYDRDRFSQLSDQLQNQPDPVSVSEPAFFPVIQARYLSFQNGMALRQVSHIPGGMGPTDINNSNIFYTVEGITENGRYFVWLQFPLSTPALSDEPMSLEDLDNLYRSNEAYETYITNKFAQLNALDGSEFTPTLAELDALAQTIFVADDASTVTSLPLNDPNCVNDATFVADVTIPDGTALSARSRFEKIWRLRNTGSCTWTAAYDLIPAAPSQIEVEVGKRPFGAVAPGAEVDISLNLVAPALAGTYLADWQLHDPFDVQTGNFPESFGPRIYVDIVVAENGRPEPPPQGEWQLYSYAYGPVHATTEAQANAQISKKAIFAPTSITFGDQSCDNLSYTARYVNPADYLLQTYQAPPETIYLGQENMDIITTNCTIPGFSDIIRLSTIHNTTLIINQDGVFYFMYQNN